MAEKIIKMKLNYKGRLLDITKKGQGKGDIQKKWFIGSNKHLFWQILDPKFPQKHLFLEEKNNQYILNITPGSELSCEKNGKTVDKEYLKSNKLLTGSQLRLTPDMSGSVALSPDWVISFEFVEPWKRVLSAEERQIISQYSRRTELTPIEKNNRNILVFATILTVVFLFVYDNFLKPEPVAVETIESKFETMIAQRMEVPKMDPRSKRVATADVGTEAAPVETGTEATTAGTAPRTSTLGSQLMAGGATASGGDGGAAAGGSSLVALTTTRAISARGFGEAGGGGGRGPGAGSSGAGGGRGGASFSSSSDPSARRGAREYVGEIASGSIGSGVQVANLQGGQGIQRFSGDAGTIKPGKPVVSGSAQAAMRRVQGSGGVRLEEGKIPEADAETRSSYESAIANIRPIQQRIQSLFNRSSSSVAMYGSILFTIYVEANGNVAVVYEVQSGEFQEDFIMGAVDIIEKWKFRTNVAMVIPMTLQFRRN